MLNRNIGFLVVFLFAGIMQVYAQTPVCRPVQLEMTASATGATNPTGNGPTIANQVITFRNNTNNPSGTAFANYSPTVTATYSISNQQYTGVSGLSGVYANGIVFGALTSSRSTDLYPTLGSFDSAVATNFSSGPTNVGSGISLTENRGVELFLATRALHNSNASLTGTYYYGDLTISFNQPVDNPIINIADFGGGSATSSSQTHYFSLQAEVTSGQTLTRLSGHAGVTLVGNNYISSVMNTANFLDGSFMVNETGVTSITFKLYIKGHDNISNWISNSTSNDITPGDAVIINVTLPNLVPNAVAPNAVFLNPTCPANTINLTTATPTAPAGVSYEWHTVATNPTAATKINNITAASTSTGLYLYARNNTSGCYSTGTAFKTFSRDCTDSDGDGILDSADLDDDNDGILDKDECVGFIANNVNGPWKGRTASNITVSATPSTTQTNSLVVSTDPQINYNINQNGGDQRFGNSAIATSYVLTFSTPVPANEIGLMIDDVNVLPNRSPNAAFKIDVDFGSGFENPNGVFIKTMAGRNSGVGYNAITGVPSFQDLPNPNDLGGEDIYLRGAGNTLVNAVRITGSNLGGSADAISYSFFALSPCDTDGDGIPNDLDLDSDNDGCPDAIEGAANLTTLVDSSMPGGNTGASSGTFNQPVIQNLGNAVNTTVGSASYGVPTIAGTGQAVGTSATANPVLAAGTAAANQVIQSGTVPATLTLTGATGTIQWQISDNNTTFANVTTGTGETTANYSPASITATRYYRAVVTSAGGCIAFSNIITITVCNAGTASPNFNNYNSTGATYSRTNSTYNILCGAGQTANLSVLVPSPAVPSGIIVTWHSASPATNANRINPVTAVTGATRKVYAAFFDSTNSCYSPTREITIYGPICAADDDYTATPILYGVPTTLPVSITANDTYLGGPVSAPNPNIVILEEYWDSAVVINPNGTLAFNTTSSILAPGIYSIYYKICDADPDAVSETNCSVGEVKFRIVSCTNPPNTDPATDFTKTGISTLEGFAGGTTGWPGNVPNGFIAIESRNKGFVITRIQNVNLIPTTELVTGMLVYEIDGNCVKMFNGTLWKCLEKDCNPPTN